MNAMEKVRTEAGKVLAMVSKIGDEKLRSRYAVAVDRALYLFFKGFKPKKLVAGGYAVKSETSDAVYHVEHGVDGTLACNCNAGKFGKPCKHKALVRICIGK